MKNYISALLFFATTSTFAVQPPKWQAIQECNQAKELAEQIAGVKNIGATKRDIAQIASMSNDGDGIVGDLSLVLFDMHKKGSNPQKFATRVHQRCMRSNGY